MQDIGRGVEEIRIKEDSGEFRVIYVCRLAQAIYARHCFQKKEQRTRAADIELSRQRYRQRMRDRKG